MQSISRFQDVLRLLPRGAFDKAVTKYRADRYCKTFDCWDHLVAMVYAQLSGMSSLRDITTGFNAQSNHHYHLGTGELKRSTLADANTRRDWRVFGDTANALLSSVGRRVRQQCRDLLFLVDSTTITLKGRGYDEWAASTRVRSTQGLKMHVQYNDGLQAPAWFSVTATNVNDLTAALGMPVFSGATYVFDKAYYDFNWWRDIDAKGARFVSRFKTTVSQQVLEDRPIDPSLSDTILKDQVVRFANPRPSAGRRNHYVQPLRRVEVSRPGQPPLVFATNDLTSAPEQIAAIYKERWGVELFFKWIKQNLNIKAFCAHSQNAVKIQVMTALITYLLLVLYRRTQGPAVPLKEQLTELRAALFEAADRAQETARKRRRRREIREFKAMQEAFFP